VPGYQPVPHHVRGHDRVAESSYRGST
jgi:hypothetical protein